MQTAIHRCTKTGIGEQWKDEKWGCLGGGEMNGKTGGKMRK